MFLIVIKAFARNSGELASEKHRFGAFLKKLFKKKMKKRKESETKSPKLEGENVSYLNEIFFEKWIH